MQEEKIPVVDTYWMTLSRPDHREVVQKETIRTSYKLVHLGVSVSTRTPTVLMYKASEILTHFFLRRLFLNTLTIG